MNGATTLSVRPTPPRFQRVRLVAIVVLSITVVWSTVGVLDEFGREIAPPATIDRVTITNTSGFLIDVDVTNPNTTGWLPISIVRPESTTITELVIDQGDTWRFRFHSAIYYGGKLTLRREALERSGWRLEIPDQVIARLHANGAQPAASE